MKKALMLLAALALTAGAAQAGTYSVLQESDCPLVSPGELAKTVHRVGLATGLDLPKDMVLRTELRCARSGKSARDTKYVYTLRTTIERLLTDGESQRWAPVAHLTGFGTAAGAASLLREVGFTVNDLIRQEP